MKKVIVLLLILLMSLCFTVSAFAAGADDGTIQIATKNGEKFFGTEIAESLIKFEAANGSGEAFYDINGDKDMDICDLVALTKNSVDFDLNGRFDAADAEKLRIILIKKGENA